jgi:hypothetical protein
MQLGMAKCEVSMLIVSFGSKRPDELSIAYNEAKFFLKICM